MVWVRGNVHEGKCTGVKCPTLGGYTDGLKIFGLG